MNALDLYQEDNRYTDFHTVSLILEANSFVLVVQIRSQDCIEVCMNNYTDHGTKTYRDHLVHTDLACIQSKDHNHYSYKDHNHHNHKGRTRYNHSHMGHIHKDHTHRGHTRSNRLN